MKNTKENKRYTVRLTFLDKNKVGKMLDDIPIADCSGGSLVRWKGELPWLDYVNVTSKGLLDTFKYIKGKDIRMSYRDSD